MSSDAGRQPSGQRMEPRGSIRRVAVVGVLVVVFAVGAVAVAGAHSKNAEDVALVDHVTTQNPTDIVYYPDAEGCAEGGALYHVNEGSGDLTIRHASNLTRIKAVDVPAISSGHLVRQYGGGSLVVIGTNSDYGAVVRMDLGDPCNPFTEAIGTNQSTQGRVANDVAFSGGHAYVAYGGGDRWSQVDLSTGETKRKLYRGYPSPHGHSLESSHGYLYQSGPDVGVWSPNGSTYPRSQDNFIFRGPGERDGFGEVVGDLYYTEELVYENATDPRNLTRIRHRTDDRFSGSIACSTLFSDCETIPADAGGAYVVDPGHLIRLEGWGSPDLHSKWVFDPSNLPFRFGDLDNLAGGDGRFWATDHRGDTIVKITGPRLPRLTDPRPVNGTTTANDAMLSVDLSDGDLPSDVVEVAFYDTTPNTTDLAATTGPQNASSIARVERRTAGRVNATWHVSRPGNHTWAAVARDSADNTAVSGPHRFRVQSKPNLAVDDLEITQAVFEPDVNNDGVTDLVQDKRTAVLVYPGGENLAQINHSTQIEVKVNGPWHTLTKRVDAQKYRETTQNDGYFVLKGVPNELGDRELTAKLDTENVVLESNETDNSVSRQATVKDTKPLTFRYHRIIPSFPLIYKAPSTALYREHTRKSNIHIQGTYPIAESEFRGSEHGILAGEPKPVVGLVKDLLLLQTTTLLNFDGDEERSIGIAHESYFDYHLQDVVGVVNTEIAPNAALVSAGYWAVTAHEIGHTYGLSHPGYKEKSRGYWVDRDIDFRTRDKDLDGVSFMHIDLPVDSNLSDIPPYGLSNSWVTKSDYEILFSNMTQNTGQDPETLIMSGLIYKNNSVVPLNWYYMEKGILNPRKDGDYRLTAVNNEGESITTRSFRASFRLTGAINKSTRTNVTGFAIQISYPDNVSKINLKRNKSVIKRFEPLPILLGNITHMIPLNAYKKQGKANVSKSRNKVLYQKFKATTMMVKKDNWRGAKNKLEHDIKPIVKRWLKDNYSQRTELELSKEEVLAVINKSINQLEQRSDKKLGYQR